MKEHDHQNEPSFRFDDFKKWMDSQTDGKTQDGPPRPARPNRLNELVGKNVYPKLTGKRLASRMTAEDGDLAELVKDFRRNGGTVIRVDEQHLIVEVDSGSFAIPKYFVTTGA